LVARGATSERLNGVAGSIKVEQVTPV
jgi:hypothetical protein